jgi:2-dehydro-3-deoxyphosphogluconate aldolase/(4S)-4-hydroxy-2-oxoglutarate aldolase
MQPEASRTNQARTLATIERSGVVAIVRLDDLSLATELTQALLAGGISAIEFTLTNRKAIETVAELRQDLPEQAASQIVLGVGTVLHADEARAAIAAGAEFIVSPVARHDVIELCQESGVVAVPGALTANEILDAWESGAPLVKVFPARAFGPSYLKDLREPLPFLRLLPTGGVSAENAGAYIANGAFAVGAGGNLVDPRLVRERNWPALSARAAAFVEAVRQARASGQRRD